MDATIYTDGAARGNPGPAASAYVMQRPGEPDLEHAEKIGAATNNVAEYTGLLLALEKATELGLRRVEIRSDSELMVRQFNGDYNVKNADLKGLYDEARALAGKLTAVRLVHVPRAENRRADELCNLVLNGKIGSGSLEPSVFKSGWLTPAGVQSTAAPAKRKNTAAQKPDVRDRAIACLRAALSAGPGPAAPTAEQIWEQLWSVLEEGGVLKSRRPKR